MWTYPLAASAAIAGAGRPQPFTLLSVESAITGVVHTFSFVARRADLRIPLESGRTSHHTAYCVVGVSAIRSDAGQADGEGESILMGYSRGSPGAPLKTTSPHFTGGVVVQATIAETRSSVRRICPGGKLVPCTGGQKCLAPKAGCCKPFPCRVARSPSRVSRLCVFLRRNG